MEHGREGNYGGDGDGRRGRFQGVKENNFRDRDRGLVVGEADERVILCNICKGFVADECISSEVKRY